MIYIYHCPDFNEIISLVLYDSLIENGIECILNRDIDNHLDELWILTVSFFDIIKWPKRYIVYQTEYFLNIQNELYIKFIKNSIQIWEYSKLNLEYLKTIHNNVIYIPFGYSKSLEIWNDISKENINIKNDVFFLGPETSYRNKIINNLIKDNISVTYFKNLVFGKERERLIASSKICLVIHKEENTPFTQDISRIYPFGAKKIFQICENIEEKNIKSVIYCPIQDLSKKIKYYLENDEERKKNINEVYNEIILNKMSDTIKNNLNLLILK